MALEQVTLQGEQVTLEPLRREHANELWDAADEPELWTYMIALVHSVDDLSRWIDGRVRAMEDGTALAFLQRDATTGKAAGSTSLFDIELAHKRMEIGHTWLGRAYRRSAMNTEAKILVFSHAFDTLDANRVQLKTDGRNVRSQKAIARLGAQHEGVLRQHVVMPDGYVRDTVMYSVVREEWPAVRARLQERLARKA